MSETSGPSFSPRDTAESALGGDSRWLCPRCEARDNGARPLHDPPRLALSQSAEQIAALCRGFGDTQSDGMEGPRGPRDPPPRPLARHLSDADRLRKVIQELMDTEKSYVKVTEGAACSSPLGLPGGVQLFVGRAPRNPSTRA